MSTTKTRSPRRPRATTRRETGDDDGEAAGGAPNEQDDRREQILRSALDVISERGFPDTRIADVAERVGVSPALVIYYFKTKDRLLTEAMRHAEDVWYEKARGASPSTTPPPARIEELVAMCTLAEPEDDSGETWADLAGSLGPVGPPPRRRKGPTGVRRALARDDPDHRPRRVRRRRVRAASMSKTSRVALSAMLDGFAIQIALADPVVDAERALPHFDEVLCRAARVRMVRQTSATSRPSREPAHKGPRRAKA